MVIVFVSDFKSLIEEMKFLSKNHPTPKNTLTNSNLTNFLNLLRVTTGLRSIQKRYVVQWSLYVLYYIFYNIFSEIVPVFAMQFDI